MKRLTMALIYVATALMGIGLPFIPAREEVKTTPVACCGQEQQIAQVQPAQPPVVRAPAKHGRGHKLPPKEVSAAQHRVSNAKHGNMLLALPKATATSYDAYTATGGSCIPPIGDQGQCGDCYMWSGFKSCSAAQMTAGVVKPGSGFMLSVQWGCDYHPELGLCNGGDEYSVAQTIQSNGAPSLASYPGAGQGQGQKKPTTGMTLYTVNQIVYVDPSQTDQGVASTQSIKNAILAYGYVSVAVSAGDDWDNYAPGQTLVGRNNGINHAVGATGWDDNHDNGDGTKGAFHGDNQWSDTWGEAGRFWIKYGAEGYGTEAFITIATTPPAPPAPPTPPTPPAPPTPPVPVVTPTWWQKLIAELESELWFQNWLDHKLAEKAAKKVPSAN